MLLYFVRYIYLACTFVYYWCIYSSIYSLTHMACLFGEPYLFCVRARASCVRTHYTISFYDDVERVRECLSGEGVALLITKPALLQTRHRLLQTSPSFLRVRRESPMKNTAVRVAPVGDSPHLMPCTASYVLQRQPP